MCLNYRVANYIILYCILSLVKQQKTRHATHLKNCVTEKDKPKGMIIQYIRINGSSVPVLNTKVHWRLDLTIAILYENIYKILNISDHHIFSTLQDKI